MVQSFDSYRSQIDYVFGHPSFPSLTARLRQATGQSGHDFIQLFEAFLNGVGVVDEALYTEAELAGNWAPIPRTILNDPAYRARLFYRVTTGSRTIMPETNLSVSRHHSRLRPSKLNQALLRFSSALKKQTGC